MLREVQLESIRRRWRAAKSVWDAYGGTYRGRLAQSANDVPTLLTEIERLAAQLGEAWLVLDGIARESKDPSSKFVAARLLVRQQAPRK